MTPEQMEAKAREFLKLRGVVCVREASDRCVTDCTCKSTIAALSALLAEVAGPGWQPIETAPRDGSRFLAWEIVGPMIEEDECGNVISRKKYSSGPVVAYVDPLFGMLDYPYCGSIVSNRRFAAWRPIAPPPSALVR